LPALLAAEPAAIAIHARTRKEMSKVPAHWERVKRAVEIRDELKSETLIIGNGDLKDLADAKEKIKQSGADGAMLGRAIFGTPWLFGPSPERALEKVLGSASGLNQTIFSSAFRLRVLVEHTKLFGELLGDVKSFAVMKKHFKAYVEGFEGAKELRIALMEAEDATQVEEIIHSFVLAHSHL
jgi:tRNA-dihydrouridine synthase